LFCDVRALTAATRTRTNTDGREDTVASLGLGHVTQDSWPAFERGLSAALTAEAPRLVEQLQGSLQQPGAGGGGGSGEVFFEAEVEEAVRSFVRGYAARWGVWEGVTGAAQR
jgi:hypothetical protein